MTGRPQAARPCGAPRFCFSRELHSSLNFRLAKKLTFRRARKLLGLGHCERFLSTGVGLSRATLDFFLSLDIPIYELYGPSECTGVHSLATGQDFRLLRWAWPGRRDAQMSWGGRSDLSFHGSLRDRAAV